MDLFIQGPNFTRSLSCIFCMFSELRPLVFQQVIRIPADSSSLTSAFAHCFKFFFFPSCLAPEDFLLFMLSLIIYSQILNMYLFIVILWWLVYVNLVHKIFKSITKEFLFFFLFFLFNSHSVLWCYWFIFNNPYKISNKNIKEQRLIQQTQMYPLLILRKNY